MRIITLLSDFGSSAPYSAEIRGVLLSRCRATLVDITHDVPPHDIAQGAYRLAAAAPHFPAGTIHLAVVDPGVGTSRQALVVASGGHFFVGPDNGLLVRAARALGRPRAVVIDAERFGRRPTSATFHGRDLFAPAAAALARGTPVDAIGPPTAALVELADEPPSRTGGVVRGRIVYVDPFGNLVTNIPGPWLTDLPVTVAMRTPKAQARLRRVVTYAEGAPGELVIVEGSDATVEIAMNAGRAADRLRLQSGDRITLHLEQRPRRGR